MKFFIIFVLSTAFYSSGFAQEDGYIGGNLTSSCMLGANGKIYTWGSNTVSINNTMYNGILGVGSTASYVPTPTLVQGDAMFNSLTFQKISAGKGNHFLAIACDGSVWAWGLNYNGQLGNGANGTVVSSPAKVKAGVLKNNFQFDDGAGNLKGVIFVSGGARNSFAILQDGRVISWGANSNDTNLNLDYLSSSGQLGDGSVIDKLSPVFVLDGIQKQPLQNIVQVCAGTNVAYALTSDGLVYSWGNGVNGQLGRTTNGSGGNPIGNTFSETGTNTISPFAYHVIAYPSFQPMQNITSLAAGAVFCFALDAQGQVWAWGNGAWGNVSGQPYPTVHADPRRVLKGATNSFNESPFLQASAVAAGEGFAMAIGVDGKPISWGNNGGCNNGGYLGDGMTNTNGSNLPRYIVNSITGQIDNDVLFIHRGETWGFYLRSDNSIHSWGCNTAGQLGIGTTSDQLKAFPYTGVARLRDPEPLVRISPRDTSICPFSFLSLTLAPAYSPLLGKNYAVQWYRNGTPFSPIQTGNFSYSDTYFPGTNNYKAQVQYIGSNIACPTTNSVSDSIVISPVTLSYSVPTTIHYTGDTLKPYAITSLFNTAYVWFSQQTNGVPLDTTLGSQETKLSASVHNIKFDGSGKTILFAEQITSEKGVILKKSQACDTLFRHSVVLTNNTSIYNVPSTQYLAYENLRIKSFDILMKISNPVPLSTQSGTLHFNVFPLKLDQNGNPGPDRTIVLFQKNYSFSITRGASESSEKSLVFTIPIEYMVSGSNEGISYYLSLANTPLSNFSGAGTLSLGFDSCAINHSLTYTDLSNTTVFAQQGFAFDQSNTQTPLEGMFFNVVLEKPGVNCGRMPVQFVPDLVTSSEYEVLPHDKMVLIPNPAQDKFEVVLQGEGTLRILDLQGMEVKRQSLAGGKNTVFTGDLSRSTYVIEVLDNSQISHSKLILE